MYGVFPKICPLPTPYCTSQFFLAVLEGMQSLQMLLPRGRIKPQLHLQYFQILIQGFYQCIQTLCDSVYSRQSLGHPYKLYIRSSGGASFVAHKLARVEKTFSTVPNLCQIQLNILIVLQTISTH